MANALTYNQVIDIMQDIAQRHYLINTFMLGKDWELENNQDIQYPLLQVYPETARLPQVNGDYKTINITLVCKVIDLVRQAEENERDVHSDCLQIAQDIVNEINQHPYYQYSNANLIGDIDFTSLEEFEDDFTAGWTFNLNLQLINHNSYCGLPFEGIPGYSVNGPSFSGEIYSTQYLTCDTVTACTNLTEFVIQVIEDNASAIWSGGTVVLDSIFEGTLTVQGNTYVSTISGNTAYLTNYYSGGTSLEQVINNLIVGAEDITRVQDGINTYTGGTDNYPTVNIVSSPSFDNILFSGTATGGSIIGSSISATTIYSGGTNLEQIILNVTGGVEDITRVQPGSNINTGGTENAPIVSLVDSPSVNNLTFSGTATGGNVSAVNLSAGTIYSGSTNLATILENYTTDNEFAGHTANTSNPHQVTAAQVGAYTIAQADALLNTKANLSGATFTGTIDAPVILSGGTNLYNIFSTTDANDITRVQPGSNINTGGTANAPIISLIANPSVNNITFSGTATGGNISAGSVSATTFYSGSTNLQSIISTVNSRLAEGISTGIISGGTLSINAGDNTKFDIAAGLGYIVDYTVYPQSTQLLSWATQTGLTVTNLATAFATDIAINASGAVLQQSSYTREELRSIIFLGGLDHSNKTNIRNIFKITVPTYGVGSSVKDLTLALGDINLDGNIFSSNGANLKIDKSAGSTFSYGRNYQNNQNDPNVISQSATTQQIFEHAFNNGAGIASFQAQGTDINPNSYDDGSGTLQVVPNNKYTIQRILMFSNSQNVFIQYGQTVYNTKDDAIANLAAASYTNLVGLKTAMVRGYLIVKQGSTTLSTSDTVFVNGDRFGGIGGGSGVAAANYYTTGSTLSGTQIIFDRNDQASAYSVNLSAMTGNVSVSGNLSATTFFSGSTNLETIISNLATGDVTRVQNGLNTYTGGTGNLPTINISAATLDHLVVSGTSVLDEITGTTIAMLNSGATDSIFVDYSSNRINTGVTNSAIIAGSGNTINSNLNNVLVAGVGLTASTSNTAYFSNVVVGGVLYSGSTNLYNIFSTTDTNDITRVQPGSNISTGGTDNLPTVSLVASPSVNNLTFSGTAIGGTVQAGAGTFTSLSATTLSGGTILSGGTNLYSIFAKTTDIPTVPTAYAYDFMAAASDETTAISSGSSKITFYAPRTFTLTGVTATLTTSGSTTTTVDVNYNGSTVFATPISLASGVYYATTATTTSSITKYGKFTVDFDAAGTGAKGVKIILEGTTTA